MYTIKSKRNSGYYSGTGCVLFFISAFCILGCSSAASHGALNGLKIACYIIIPSIFPFTVCSVFFQKSGGLLWVSGKLNKITKAIFNLSGTEFSVILLSLLGGYPIGAKITDELYRTNVIDKSTSKRLLSFSVNPSPAFIISVVGGSVLNSVSAGVMLFISNLTACFILSGLFTLKPKKKTVQISMPISSDVSVSDAFVESVRSAAEITINICAFVVLFASVAEILKLALSGGLLYSALCPLLEISFGITEISKIGIPAHAYSFLLCFGGISTICQVKQAAVNIKPTFKFIVFHRLLHGITATIISFVLFKIFPKSSEVLSNVNEVKLANYPLFLPSVMLIIFSILFLNFVTNPKDKKLIDI